MTKSDKIRSLIVGSYIVYLTSLLDRKERVNRTTIDLSQWILSKRKKTGVKNIDEIIKLSDTAWREVMELFREDKIKIAISMVIETLYFNHEVELSAMYGEELGNRVVRFSNKQSYDGISEYAKDSYKVSDALTASVRDSVYKYLRDK